MGVPLLHVGTTHERLSRLRVWRMRRLRQSAVPVRSVRAGQRREFGGVAMTKQEVAVRLDLYAQELERMGMNLTRIFEGLDGATAKDRDLLDLLSDATDRVYNEAGRLRLFQRKLRD